MSEYQKLKNEYHKKCEVWSQKLLKDFMEKVGKLQVECKHPVTHWMQELNTDGSFKEGLFKRCYVCGATVDTLDIDESFINLLLDEFDENCEDEKRLQLLRNAKK
jgi:hypothetical protein